MSAQKTCTRCKAVKDVTEFSPNGLLADGTTARDSRCKPCKAAIVKNKYSTNPEYRERALASKRTEAGREIGRKCYDKHKEARRQLTLEKYREKQTGTVDQAVNKGKEWTGPELEIALREDLTAAEAAAKLGRTFAAVRRMRERHGRDPRKQALAGIAKGGHE